MYHHVKKLMFTVRVAAAMQYSIQGLNCEDPDRKDLLMDIGTEELSHLEIVGCQDCGMSGADASQTIQIRSSGR